MSNESKHTPGARPEALDALYGPDIVRFAYAFGWTAGLDPGNQGDSARAFLAGIASELARLRRVEAAVLDWLNATAPGAPAMSAPDATGHRQRIRDACQP